MRIRTALGTTLAVAVAVPALVAVVAVARVHLYARRALAQSDPDGATIVVFGSQALQSGPGLVLRSRLDHALSLYYARPGRRIAMAGGVPASTDVVRGGHDEVAAMLAYAREHGVPEEDLLAVRPGQNTRGQLSSTRRVVVDAGLGPVIGVSSSYHMARICDEARRQGFEVLPSAVVDSPETRTARGYLTHACADALGLLWYAAPHWLSQRVDTSAGSLRHLGVGFVAGRYTWRAVKRRPRV